MSCFFFLAVPKMQFKERVYTCNENDGRVVAMIYRSGDIQHRSSVRCYTRQGSAQVMMDFEERPNTDVSTVTFLPGMCELEKVLDLLSYLFILCGWAWGRGMRMPRADMRSQMISPRNWNFSPLLHVCLEDYTQVIKFMDTVP